VEELDDVVFLRFEREASQPDRHDRVVLPVVLLTRTLVR